MGKKMESGNCYSIVGDVQGMYRDNGKGNGNYYSILGGSIGILEKKMETTIVL